MMPAAVDARPSPPVMPGAEPFHYAGRGDVACLLIHGFMGTTNEVRSLGQHLSQHGVSSMGILLTGHGTHPGELTRSTYRDWIADVERALDALKASGKRVFLCGMSMGGTLALNVAARRASTQDVAGVITLSTPIRLLDSRRPAAALVALFRRWQRWHEPDIQDRAARKHHVAYRGLHLPAVRQLVRLIRDTRALLPLVRQPLLVMHSRFDHTVPAAEAELILGSTRSVDRELIWLGNSYHVITMDSDAPLVRAHVGRFIHSRSRA